MHKITVSGTPWPHAIILCRCAWHGAAIRRDRRRAYRTVSGRWDTDIDNWAMSRAESDPDDWQTSDPCTPDTTSVDSRSCDTVTSCRFHRCNIATAWCMLQLACSRHTGPLTAHTVQHYWSCSNATLPSVSHGIILSIMLFFWSTDLNIGTLETRPKSVTCQILAILSRLNGSNGVWQNSALYRH